MTKVWPKTSELLKLFGNPSDRGWREANIVSVKPLPFKMYVGKLQISRIEMNKFCAYDLAAILEEIWATAGKKQKVISEWGMDRFDGSFVIRNIRGSNRISNHAFGLAADFNARRNPLGVKPGVTPGSFVNGCPVVKIFDKHNVFWGGRYKKRPDGMHFEWVRY